jgi:hypothetical protein
MAEPEGWHVISQRNTERFMPSGNFDQVVEVTVQADDGTTNVLVVPVAKYARDTVVALGNAWIERHNDVASLGN